jgi:hypothetical protein
MSSPIASIFRQLAEKKWHNVLTFPHDYIFDSYWAASDLNVWMWIYKIPFYNPSLLPHINLINKEILPIDIDYDIIVVHDPYSFMIGKQLSNNYNIPLV